MIFVLCTNLYRGLQSAKLLKFYMMKWAVSRTFFQASFINVSCFEISIFIFSFLKGVHSQVLITQQTMPPTQHETFYLEYFMKPISMPDPWKHANIQLKFEFVENSHITNIHGWSFLWPTLRCDEVHYKDAFLPFIGCNNCIEGIVTTNYESVKNKAWLANVEWQCSNNDMKF
jgi:hypothetical protein